MFEFKNTKTYKEQILTLFVFIIRIKNIAMHSLDHLKSLIDKEIKDLGLKIDPKDLYDPVSYILHMGGKRIRPLLTLLSCDMFGGNVTDAIKPALGMEMFHNFTLIHDDIMDNAEIRRGKDTVHKKWNGNQAILSGDAMLILANQMMLQVENKLVREVMDLYNECGLKVCEGQQYDMNYEKTENISLNDYLKMIELKTAVLLAGCLRLGAVIAKTDNNNKELIEQFGINLGISFQIEDDLLDAFGDADTFGKKIGGDIIINKKTFLLVKAMELADHSQLTEIKYWLNKENIQHEEKIKNIIRIYSNLQIEKIALETSKYYFDEAMKYLDQTDVDHLKKIRLKEYVNGFFNRNI